MTPVDEQVATIGEMALAEVRAEWAQQFEQAAPPLSSSLLRRRLAHAVQEKAYGALSRTSTKALEAMAGDTVGHLPDLPLKLKAGTRLVREWNGKMHSVLVTDEGFEFDGKTYRSLSIIARHITGAHWSGPRFFGLKRRPPPPRKQNLGLAE